MAERKQVKKDLFQLIKDLREYTFEMENLYYDMDDLTDVEFDKRSDEIQDKYLKKHIEYYLKRKVFMHEECEHCVKRKFCVKEEPKDDEHCEDYEQDEKLFN